MSKKKQISFSALLVVGAILFGLIFLEGGGAKTLLNAEKPGACLASFTKSASDLRSYK